jgi:hypothetical protein
MVLIAGMIALAVVGSTCGWVLRAELTERTEATLRKDLYLRTLLTTHRMFGSDRPSGQTRPPSEFASLETEIERLIGARVRLPASGSSPLAFRGGRLLPLGERPAALLVFEREQGRVSMIIVRDGVDGGLAAFNRPMDDTSISVAGQGDLRLGIVGKVSSEELKLLKQMIGEHAGPVGRI